MLKKTNKKKVKKFNLYITRFKQLNYIYFIILKTKIFICLTLGLRYD